MTPSETSKDKKKIEDKKFMRLKCLLIFAILANKIVRDEQRKNTVNSSSEKPTDSKLMQLNRI